jgi:putative ABC transport system substrate-binding protein
MVRLDRRRLLQAGCAALLSSCGPPDLIAKHRPTAARRARIGYLCPGCPTGQQPPPTSRYWVWLDALRGQGYAEGENLSIEFRGTDQVEALPTLARELADLGVAVIVTGGGSPAALAAQKATGTIPIVFIAVGDPVGTGLVASYARPGGNATGLSNLIPDTAGKRLELLKEVVPHARRLNVFWDLANPARQPERLEMEAAARRLGLTIRTHDVRSSSMLEAAFQALTAEPPDGLYLGAEPFVMASLPRVAELIEASRLPTLHPGRELVAAGGLMAYGVNLADLWRRAAVYVDRIPRGSSPADLPVEQPTTFDFIVNQRTARRLGLWPLAESVLQQVTEFVD